MKSDKQQRNDPTENWLRQTLGSHRPEAPADAWQRLAPHLPQRKRRRPFVFWLSGAAVGAAAAVALFWFLKSAAPSVAPPAAVKNGSPVAQAAPAVLPKNLTAGESAKIWTDKSPGVFAHPNFEKKTAEKLRGFSSSKNLENPPAEGFASPGNLGTAPVFEAADLKKETTGAFDFSEKTTAEATQFSEKTAPPKAENPLEKLPGKTLAPLLLAEKPLPEFQSEAAPILPKKAQVPRFWLGIEAAPSLFMQKNMGGMPVGLAFPETHPRPGNGWQAGISLAFEPVKNWRVALGIQHFRQTHAAQHAATLRLMDGVCLNPHDPGLKEYQFQYAVVSGGEESNLTLRLQQQDIGSTMPDDEPFTLEMKTIHRSAAWRVPLSIERRFGTGKWQGFVRGGAVVDFSEKSTVEVTHFTEVCQDLCFQNGHLPSVQASARAGASVGWLAGAGIERRILRRAALRFEPFMVGQKGSMQCGLNLGLLFSN